MKRTDFIEIYSAQDIGEMAFVQSLFDAHDIPAFRPDAFAENLSFLTSPFFRRFSLYVAPQDADRARALIAEYVKDRPHKDRPGMRLLARYLLVFFVFSILFAIAVSFRSSPKAPHPSLTGSWIGTFSYLRSPGATPSQVVFKASLVQIGDRLVGSIKEPNTFDTSKEYELTSTLLGGKIIGDNVIFQKQYHRTVGDSPLVTYQGIFDPQLRTITGQWFIGKSRGRFSMRWVNG